MARHCIQLLDNAGGRIRTAEATKAVGPEPTGIDRYPTPAAFNKAGENTASFRGRISLSRIIFLR